MSLFRKPKKVTPALISDEEINAFTGVNYDNVLGWLVGLSEVDFDKVTKVANIYRKADFEAAQELEVTNEPTTFINPPEPEATDEPAFLEEIDHPKPKSKTTKIAIKE